MLRPTARFLEGDLVAVGDTVGLVTEVIESPSVYAGRGYAKAFSSRADDLQLPRTPTGAWKCDVDLLQFALDILRKGKNCPNLKALLDNLLQETGLAGETTVEGLLADWEAPGNGWRSSRTAFLVVFASRALADPSITWELRAFFDDKRYRGFWTKQVSSANPVLRVQCVRKNGVLANQIKAAYALESPRSSLTSPSEGAAITMSTFEWDWRKHEIHQRKLDVRGMAHTQLFQELRRFKGADGYSTSRIS